MFNADNGMTSFGGATLSYDGNGNLTSDGTNSYTWDARNHLTAISGATTASFTYDAFGRRVSKTVAGRSTQFLYDGLNPVQEMDSSTGLANLLTGLNIDEYFTRTDSNNNVSTQLTDALGSTIGWVGSGQSIATSYTYQPFGATTVGGTPNGSSHEFTGRENDGTGLYFYRARYYSPTFQRFIAQDPIGFAGHDSNLYRYTFDSPLQFEDPLGLTATCYAFQNGGIACFDDDDPTNTNSDPNSYSGGGTDGPGFDNPTWQDIPDEGPIPANTYNIGPGYNSRLGQPTMKLTPTEPFPPLRDPNSIRMHADKKGKNQGKGLASTGCEVTSPQLRQWINNLGGGTLIVVPGMPIPGENP
jgi:RHS repeat-associated protein